MSVSQQPDQQAVDPRQVLKRWGRGARQEARSVEDALDYAPNLGIKAQRLARRCWPG